MNNKNPFEFKFPSNFPRHYVNSLDVALYSMYLKSLGADQTLKYGDWYYIRDEETNQPVAYLFEKEDALEELSGKSMDFFLNGEYVRAISQDEAISIMRRLRYEYSENNPPIDIDQEDGETTVAFDNHQLQIGIVTSASNPHAAHLKAACLACAQSKAFSTANEDLVKSKMFNLGIDFNEG